MGSGSAESDGDDNEFPYLYQLLVGSSLASRAHCSHHSTTEVNLLVAVNPRTIIDKKIFITT